MSDEAKKVSIQVGPSGMTLLTIVFVLLKVFNKIDWSWWWVFAPLWVPFAVLAVLLLLALIAHAIATALE